MMLKLKSYGCWFLATGVPVMFPIIATVLILLSANSFNHINLIRMRIAERLVSLSIISSLHSSLITDG